MHFGYGAINAGGHSGRALRAHRVSWNIHNGNIPEGLFVLHRCDIPACVNPEHLFLGTILDNNRDMCSKGRHNKIAKAKGGAHGMSKLTSEEVSEIRDSRASKIGVRELASRYSVSMAQISRIALKQSWRHI